jgi:cobalamin synthase
MSEDRTTVLEKPADEDEYDDEYRGPGRWIAIAAVGAVALGVAGYFAGHASAGSGPTTLAEAVQQAQDGKLACGDTGTAAATPAPAQGGGAPPAGGAPGAFFLRAICDRGGGQTGGTTGATGQGFRGAASAARRAKSGR